jgi:hypothetical protein
MSDDHSVEMQYVMWIDRDAATTRYTFQLNDIICRFGVADWEAVEMRSSIGAVSSARKLAREMRATMTDEVLWAHVELDHPVYYERARALGWHAHRPFKAR